MSVIDVDVAEAMLRAAYPRLPAVLPYPINVLLPEWKDRMVARDPSVRSERIGEYSVTYGSGGEGFAAILTPWELGLLEPYTFPATYSTDIGGDSFGTSPRPPVTVSSGPVDEPQAGYYDLPPITRGTDWEWTALLREDGAILELTDADAKVSQPAADVDLAPVVGGDFKVTITLTPTDTAALQPGKWRWDLYGTTATTGRHRILQGAVSVIGGLAEVDA